jgi:drug/metabolite transporter (DMT)-like permease
VSPFVVALIAAAAVAHATWNIALKRSGASGTGVLWLSFLVSVVVFTPFGVVALVESGADLAHWAGFAVVSGLLQVGYFLLLQRAYSAGDVSVVYPLARGSGPLLSVVLAVVLLHERPAPLALVGIAVIVAGVVVIGFAGGGHANRAGILYGLAVGVVIACYTVWDSNAVLDGAMPPVALYFGAVVVQASLLAPSALREGTLAATARRHWPTIVLVGVLSPLAYILVLIAVQHAPVSLVAPAREVSVVLVGLAGWLIFREPHPVQRLVGAAVVLVGVALLVS